VLKRTPYLGLILERKNVVAGSILNKEVRLPPWSHGGKTIIGLSPLADRKRG